MYLIMALIGGLYLLFKAGERAGYRERVMKPMEEEFKRKRQGRDEFEKKYYDADLQYLISHYQVDRKEAYEKVKHLLFGWDLFDRVNSYETFERCLPDDIKEAIISLASGKIYYKWRGSDCSASLYLPPTVPSEMTRLTRGFLVWYEDALHKIGIDTEIYITESYVDENYKYKKKLVRVQDSNPNLFFKMSLRQFIL